MDDTLRHVSELLERAQSGEAATVLAEAEEALRTATGAFSDRHPGLHFVRVVALGELHRHDEAIEAAELMVQAADRTGHAGWRSCALSGRGGDRILAGERAGTGYDVEAVLRDLVDAEAALDAGEPDAAVARRARTGIALRYQQLRLFELAVPHHEEAYQASLLGSSAGEQAMWLLNITKLHLEWALELYRVNHPGEAEAHTREAHRVATLAIERADQPGGERWRDIARLFACCAEADGTDPAGALAGIERHVATLEAQHRHTEILLCRPFHAVALRRSGRMSEALQVIEQAISTLPEGAEWSLVAGLRHTHGQLLAASGATGATIALRYGDTLAQALWQQRIRTLHVATTMQSYESLRLKHAEATRRALTDALTGIANRRAFDDAVQQLRRTPSAEVAVLLADLDHFKEVNDTSGHEAGDVVLRAVARALIGNLRDGDLVVRFGGDEFGALLPGASVASAERVAKRMVAATKGVEGSPVTMSIGVAAGRVEDLDKIIAAADAAMYVAKRAGGGQVARHVVVG